MASRETTPTPPTSAAAKPETKQAEKPKAEEPKKTPEPPKDTKKTEEKTPAVDSKKETKDVGGAAKKDTTEAKKDVGGAAKKDTTEAKKDVGGGAAKKDTTEAKKDVGGAAKKDTTEAKTDAAASSDKKEEATSNTQTPEPVENGEAPGTPKGPTLREQFRVFSKFGDTKSDGKLLTLSQSDKWMKQAKVIDGKTITTTDTAITFKKLKQMKVAYPDYEKYLAELAKYKNQDAKAIKDKLRGCGTPGTRGTTTPKTFSFLCAGCPERGQRRSLRQTH